MAAGQRLRVAARPESIPALREMALGEAQRAGLTPEALLRLELVLEEALMNVVRHAYGAGGGDMELECRAAGTGRLHLVLRDWGAPFDPLSTADAALEARLAANLEAGLERRTAGGLGLYLIRGMARAAYRREGGANVLSFAAGEPPA